MRTPVCVLVNFNRVDLAEANDLVFSGSLACGERQNKALRGDAAVRTAARRPRSISRDRSETRKRTGDVQPVPVLRREALQFLAIVPPIGASPAEPDDDQEDHDNELR